MNQRTLNIGMISFAHGHAYSYANALQRLPNVEIVAIHDDDDQRGNAAAERYGSGFFASCDSLLENELDGVVICSENSQHRAHVEAAAGHTPNILCEKPLSISVDDAQAMIDICNRTNTRLQTAFPVRFSPPIQQLKALLDEEKLGRIYGAKCTNHGSMPGSWFIQAALSGGGAVIDHTVHVIDLLHWFWNTEVTEVYAEIGHSLLHPELGIDDVGMLSFTLANGIYGTLDTSWSRPASYTTWGNVKIELVGEQGAIQVDAFAQHIAVSSNAWGKTRQVGWGSDMDFGLISDFVEMIRNDRAPSITGKDGMAAVAVALAAYRSAEIGKPVKL